MDAMPHNQAPVDRQRYLQARDACLVYRRYRDVARRAEAGCGFAKMPPAKQAQREARRRRTVHPADAFLLDKWGVTRGDGGWACRPGLVHRTPTALIRLPDYIKRHEPSWVVALSAGNAAVCGLKVGLAACALAAGASLGVGAAVSLVFFAILGLVNVFLVRHTVTRRRMFAELVAAKAAWVAHKPQLLRQL